MSKLLTTIEPIHVGEILKEEFMIPLGLSANALAKYLGVPPNRISLIASRKRGISADTAILLSMALGTTAEFWMNLQKDYEIEIARDKREVAKLPELEPMRMTA